MRRSRRKCEFFNCNVSGDVRLSHIVDNIYVYLCVGHVRMALSAKYSTVSLIEFLISMKGDGHDYRARMREFVLKEVKAKIDGR